MEFNTHLVPYGQAQTEHSQDRGPTSNPGSWSAALPLSTQAGLANPYRDEVAYRPQGAGTRHDAVDSTDQSARNFSWIQTKNGPSEFPEGYTGAVQTTLKDIIARLSDRAPVEDEPEWSIRNRRLSDITKNYHNVAYLGNYSTGVPISNQDSVDRLNDHNTMDWVWASSALYCQNKEIEWLNLGYQPTANDKTQVATTAICHAISTLNLPGLESHQEHSLELYRGVAQSMKKDYEALSTQNTAVS